MEKAFEQVKSHDHEKWENNESRNSGCLGSNAEKGVGKIRFLVEAGFIELLQCNILVGGIFVRIYELRYGIVDGVFEVPNQVSYGAFRRSAYRLQQALLKAGPRVRGAYRLSRLARILVEPRSLARAFLGQDDFYYPGSASAAALPGFSPDIIHLHNLHSDYFDLRILPDLSNRVPTIVTLHDMWWLTGQCFSSLDCRRWVSGCFKCPQVGRRSSLLPAWLRWDGSAHNWKLKNEIYRRSRLYVAAPSRWMIGKVRESILAPAVVEYFVIPHGADKNIFHPADRIRTRSELCLPASGPILLTVASSLLNDSVKNFSLIRAAVQQLAAGRSGKQPDRILLLAIGADSPSIETDGLQIRFVPFMKDRRELARYYQAADLYLHGARHDNFPNTVLEALACGTPVVATAVGGIPEQVASLDIPGRSAEVPAAPLEFAVGALVPSGDVGAMSSAIEWLLDEPQIRLILGSNAARISAEGFGLDRQVRSYLSVYEGMSLNCLPAPRMTQKKCDEKPSHAHP